MGGGDGVTDLVRPECPQKRDALGGRERQVVAGASFLGQPGSQVVPGGGPAGEQVPESLGVDLADKSEPFGRRSDPLARRFTPSEVVVIDVVGDLVEVVLGAAGGAEPPYRQHRGARQRVFGDRSMTESSGSASPRTSPPPNSAVYQEERDPEAAGFPPGGRRTRRSARVCLCQSRAGAADGLS